MVDLAKLRLLTWSSGAAGWLPHYPPDYSGTQSGKAFLPTAAAYNRLPFFRVTKGLKMSLKPGRWGVVGVVIRFGPFWQGRPATHSKKKTIDEAVSTSYTSLPRLLSDASL
jgi:hypothetical protein